MRTRLCRFIQSPDANEGAPTPSKYSTERSSRTALLFDGKRKLALPVIELENLQTLKGSRVEELKRNATRSDFGIANGGCLAGAE